MYQGDQPTSLRCDCKTDCKDTDTNDQISVVSHNIQSIVVSEANADVCNSASVVVILRVLVGLLVVLVAVTITGWVWTYLVLKRRGKLNISSKLIR